MIAVSIRSFMRAARVLSIVSLLSPVSANAQEGEAAEPSSAPRIALVLDASGSMNAALPDGQTRFDVARSAVADMVDGLPATTVVGLRVYGHQSTPDQKNCDDTALVVPFGAAAERAAEIRSSISGLKALGFTPISLSLQAAAQDLTLNGDGPGTVILVSDGKETCKSDPCAVAASLAKANASLVVHTIGFGVDDVTRRQLQCIAGNARGTFYDANSVASLKAKLGEAARTPAKEERPPPVEVKKLPVIGVLTVKGIGEAGVNVINSETQAFAATVGTVGGNRAELPPGIYSVEFTNGPWTGVEIKAGQTTELVPAYLKIENPTQQLLGFIDIETGEEIASVNQAAMPLIAMMPGRYHLRLNGSFDYRDVDFKAGATTTIKPGIVRIVEGRDNHYYRIRSLATGVLSLGGLKGEDIGLPAGRYEIFDPENEQSKVELEIGEHETREVRLPQ